jgi:anti-sigma regulatory factor (Ser/Thr protein kinase)
MYTGDASTQSDRNGHHQYDRNDRAAQLEASRRGLVELASEPNEVAAARQHALDVCRGRLDGRRCDDLALAVSELVTNAIRHGGDPVTLRVVPNEHAVRVEVTDGNPELTLPPGPTLLATGQRGLRLVDAVCRAWGWHPVEGGKCVWCEI